MGLGFVSNAKKHTYLSQRKSFSYNLIKFMYFKQYEIQLYFMALKVLSDASNTYISLKVLLPLKRISTAVFEYSSQTQKSTQKLRTSVVRIIEQKEHKTSNKKSSYVNEQYEMIKLHEKSYCSTKSNFHHNILKSNNSYIRKSAKLFLNFLIFFASFAAIIIIIL